MLLQRMSAHEAEHHGEALSLDARPDARNHARREFAPARLETDSPNAGNELAFLHSSCLPYSMSPRAATCCGLFLPKILDRATSPRKRQYPPRSAPAAK